MQNEGRSPIIDRIECWNGLAFDSINVATNDRAPLIANCRSTRTAGSRSRVPFGLIDRRPGVLALGAAVLAAATLAGCAAPPRPQASAARFSPVDRTDRLLALATVEPGRLEYAADGSTFAPILTEPAAYPTQRQANNALRRLRRGALHDHYHGALIRLFACKPGLLEGRTARVIRDRGFVVHCAAEFIDGRDHRLGRLTANFAHDGSVWTIQPVALPRFPVPWTDAQAGADQLPSSHPDGSRS